MSNTYEKALKCANQIAASMYGGKTGPAFLAAAAKKLVEEAAAGIYEDSLAHTDEEGKKSWIQYSDILSQNVNRRTRALKTFFDACVKDVQASKMKFDEKDDDVTDRCGPKQLLHFDITPIDEGDYGYGVFTKGSDKKPVALWGYNLASA